MVAIFSAAVWHWTVVAFGRNSAAPARSLAQCHTLPILIGRLRDALCMLPLPVEYYSHPFQQDGATNVRAIHPSM